MTEGHAPEQSPDLLAASAVHTGVRRLTRLPILLTMVFGSLIAGGMVYTVQERQHHTQQAAAEPADPAKAAASTAPPPVLTGAPTRGAIAPAKASFMPDLNTAAHPVAARAVVPESATYTAVPGQPEGIGHPSNEAWSAYQQQLAQVQAAQFAAERAALDASPEVKVQNDGENPSSPSAASQPLALTASQSDSDPTAAMRNMTAAIASATSGSKPMGLNAANGQTSKADWLNQEPNTANYLPRSRVAAVSPFEVKAGTVIPAEMIGGVNSDMPGQLIAQVAENVYDSATGRYLLIPQGAKLIGTYDNQVTFGQSRVLVGWQRIIYPDASSLDIVRMPGADLSGYAGFKDKVNNHLFRTFSEAFLLSIFSAGIQLGQPQSSNGQNYSSTQIVAAAISQQMGELGMEIVRRNMDVAPTLEVRPGYTFNVMVTKDMVITPWAAAN